MKTEKKRLEKEIAALLQRAEGTDAQEDERFGAGMREEDIPQELHRREERLDKIRQAKKALEREALIARAESLEAQAEGQETKAATHPDPSERRRAATRGAKTRREAHELRDRFDDDDPPPSHTGTSPSGLATHRVRTTADAEPHEKAQYNFTDPQSRIQEKGGAFLQGYGCQAVVDAEAQVIVAAAVTNAQPDNAHLLPMLMQVEQNTGALPDVVLGDAGYWQPTGVEQCAQRGVDVYIATGRTRRSSTFGSPPGATIANEGPRAAMAAKLSTPEGRELYARRKAIVEPVFGQIKEARGLRRFLLRGMQKVTGEWLLLAATHNLLKLHRRLAAVT